MVLGAMRFVAAAFPAVLLVRPPKVPLRLYLAAGLTLSVGQFAFLFSAIRAGMPIGLASVVVQSQAFFTLLLSSVFLRERCAPTDFAGLALAASGLALIGVTRGGGMPLVGFLLSLGAAASWATGNVVTRAVGAYRANMFAFVAWSALVPPIPFLVLSVLFDGRGAIAGLAHARVIPLLGSVAFLGWVSTLVGYGLWSRLLSRHSPSLVAPFSFIVPFVGIAAGAIVYGERLKVGHIAGAALILTGLFLNVFGSRLGAKLPATRPPAGALADEASSPVEVTSRPS
jgi:O-acetylserine/cysteine efflux transporter